MQTSTCGLANGRKKNNRQTEAMDNRYTEILKKSVKTKIKKLLCTIQQTTVNEVRRDGKTMVLLVLHNKNPIRVQESTTEIELQKRAPDQYFRIHLDDNSKVVISRKNILMMEDVDTVIRNRVG